MVDTEVAAMECGGLQMVGFCLVAELEQGGSNFLTRSPFFLVMVTDKKYIF